MALPFDQLSAVMRALDLIGQGRSRTSACDEAGVAIPTFNRYVRETPELSAAFEDAEQRGYDVMADSLIEIDRTCAIAGVTDPKVMKILSDNIRWFLARKRPQQYGERVTVTHNITADKAIVDALQRGKERAIAGGVIEDVTYTVVKEHALPAPAERVLNIDGLDPELLQFL